MYSTAMPGRHRMMGDELMGTTCPIPRRRYPDGGYTNVHLKNGVRAGTFNQHSEAPNNCVM